jgi:hypothetical protein
MLNSLDEKLKDFLSQLRKESHHKKVILVWDGLPERALGDQAIPDKPTLLFRLAFSNLFFNETDELVLHSGASQST